MHLLHFDRETFCVAGEWDVFLALPLGAFNTFSSFLST
jgi:hypothetical protein